MCLAALSLGLACCLLVFAIPKMTSVGWRVIGDTETDLSPLRLVELTAIWAVGLYAYTFALAAALPGLRRRHALALNLSGSGVSNVLPFGGAAGIGLNYAMLHSWGFDRRRATTFTLVSQTVSAAVKVGIALMGAVALVAIPSAHNAIPHADATVITVGSLVVVLVSSVYFVIRRGHRWRWLATVRRSTANVLLSVKKEMRGRWWRVIVPTSSYAVLQLVLFCACLDVAQAQLPIEIAVFGYAIDRLLTLLPVTPGGVGVVEAGTSGLLIVMGGDPAAVVTGVLLFRGFSYLAEIPLGGAVTLGWLVWRSKRGLGERGRRRPESALTGAGC